MVADFMDHRPSPEGAPASPLWLRPTAALGEISGVFSLRVSLEAFLTAACRIGSGTNGEMESSVVHPHSKRHQESGCAGGY
jgi:hypothetical protein